eukprot:scaffold11710_cov179-Ochromonas_danica.AAC.1
MTRSSSGSNSSGSVNSPSPLQIEFFISDFYVQRAKTVFDWALKLSSAIPVRMIVHSPGTQDENICAN